MSDTPRTDQIELGIPSWQVADNSRSLDFARQLERELAAQTQRAENIERQTRNWLNRCTVLQWIPVSDMSPEDDQDVLVIAGGSVRVAHRWHDHLGEGSWRWSNGSDRRMDGVTHWCPWPTAPKL